MPRYGVAPGELDLQDDQPINLPPARTAAINYVTAVGLLVIASIGCLHLANTAIQRRSDLRDFQRYITAAPKRSVPSPAISTATTVEQPLRPVRASARRPEPQVKRAARPTPHSDHAAVIDWLFEKRPR